MANPKISTLTDVFLNDGFGFFGFGDGGFGGSYDLLNPQWNTNSGSYGFDPIQQMSYVEATNTPSYVGASLYDLTENSFFAKITPAASGSGSVQTGLLIRFDRTNYVEISVGPNGQFNAYVSNNTAITTTPMPTYDPVAHAYWRIRNEDPSNIFFDTSPDGSNWTEQGFVGFDWDITSVTVSLFAGFTGIENPFNLAYISNVNQPATNLQLKGSVSAGASISGSYIITDPNALSGSVNAAAGLRGKFTATLGIPEGGMTDFAYTFNTQTVDPIMINQWTPNNFLNFTGIGTPLTTASWQREFNAFQIPMPYRDGSYFQPAAYVDTQYNVGFAPDSTPNLLTGVQMEQTSGLDNRLPLDASIFLNGCAFSGSSCSITRSTVHPLNGQYSGQMISTNSPGTIGDGNKAYWLIPQRKAMVTVRDDGLGTKESFFGSVYFSTTRASTIWFASMVYYDVNWNIISGATSGTTYTHTSITNKNTHPGGGVWQKGNVYDNNVPANAVYASVVPVIQNPSNLVETTYVSNLSVTTASLGFTETPSTYAHPRNANINVKADRVNYVLNSGFNAGSTYWFQGNVGITGTPNAATMTWDNTVGYQSAGSLRLDVVPPSGTYTGSPGSKIGVATQANFNGGSRQPVIQGLKVGHTYTLTAWIKQGPNCPDVLMDFRDSNSLGLAGVSINSTKITNPENTDGYWTRFQVTYTVPPTGLSEYFLFFYVTFGTINQAPFSFWVDSIMLEEAVDYQGYFDGGYASADYKWESGGAANLSRSYYYKDYNNKFLRLNSALPNVLPVGESYNLLFAQPIT